MCFLFCLFVYLFTDFTDEINVNKQSSSIDLSH